MLRTSAFRSPTRFFRTLKYSKVMALKVFKSYLNLDMHDRANEILQIDTLRRKSGSAGQGVDERRSIFN